MQLSESPAAMLRIVNVPHTQWRHLIEPSSKVIGRSIEAEIQVPAVYQTVSLRHAEVCREDDVLLLCDLGSHAGTWVNGVPLPPHRPTRVVIGDDLLLGDLNLKIQRWPEPSLEIGHEPFAADTIECSTRASRELLKRLSGRELDIVMWMRRGFTDDVQLSQVLQRSPHTIRTQVSSILHKLDLHSRAAVIALNAPMEVASE